MTAPSTLVFGVTTVPTVAFVTASPATSKVIVVSSILSSTCVAVSAARSYSSAVAVGMLTVTFASGIVNASCTASSVLPKISVFSSPATSASESS